MFSNRKQIFDPYSEPKSNVSWLWHRLTRILTQWRFWECRSSSILKCCPLSTSGSLSFTYKTWFLHVRSEYLTSEQVRRNLSETNPKDTPFSLKFDIYFGCSDFQVYCLPFILVEEKWKANYLNTALNTSSETQGQSVSKGAGFKISNAEWSEAESGEAEGRSASPWGHYLTGLVLGPPNCTTCPITFVSCDIN